MFRQIELFTPEECPFCPSILEDNGGQKPLIKHKRMATSQAAGICIIGDMPMVAMGNVSHQPQRRCRPRAGSGSGCRRWAFPGRRSSTWVRGCGRRPNRVCKARAGERAGCSRTWSSSPRTLVPVSFSFLVILVNAHRGGSWNLVSGPSCWLTKPKGFVREASGCRELRLPEASGASPARTRSRQRRIPRWAVCRRGKGGFISSCLRFSFVSQHARVAFEHDCHALQRNHLPTSWMILY